ncbi:hypothetical protein [Algoriphagus sp. A40]|uniref:hypothetical protein n=1 Tax=Algoriphagus sp. A40 TaxID=1945863 RepID=UPI0009878EDC|nr:hypothetical protein [Algoriphagus sp. A40]OOG73762.1 hypothetical protein B0E43_13025 [Algoriphagus sp. A40]
MKKKHKSGWLRLLVLKSGKSIARLFIKKESTANGNKPDHDTTEKPQIRNAKEEILKEIDNL